MNYIKPFTDIFGIKPGERIRHIISGGEESIKTLLYR